MKPSHSCAPRAFPSNEVEHVAENGAVFRRLVDVPGQRCRGLGEQLSFRDVHEPHEAKIRHSAILEMEQVRGRLQAFFANQTLARLIPSCSDAIPARSGLVRSERRGPSRVSNEPS